MEEKWSHWRELNSRPTPYQGVAIPLSHSGSRHPTSDSNLTTADKKTREVNQGLWCLPIQQTEDQNRTRRFACRGRIAWYCA